MSNNNSFDLNNNDESFESLSNSDDSSESDVRHKTKEDNSNHPLHGLSSSSQDLICDFYQILNGEQSDNINIFEKIVCSVIQDVQKYQKDVLRLEQSYIREKEQNEKFMKHIEEDTEHQLEAQAEKIRNEERERWLNEKKALILNYDSEIATFKSCICQYEIINKSLTETINEDTQIVSLKKEISELLAENRQLKSTFTETQTQLALSRSEIANLKTLFEEKRIEIDDEKSKSIEFYEEMNNLKQQVQMLQDANRKLHDINDDLRAYIEKNKIKILRSQEKMPLPTSYSSYEMRKDSVMCNYFNNSTRRRALSNNKDTLVLHSQQQGILSLSHKPLSYYSIEMVPSESLYNELVDSGFSTLNEISNINSENNYSSDFAEKTEYEQNSDEVFSQDNGDLRVDTSSNLASRKPLKSDEAIISTPIQKTSQITPDRMFKIVFAGDAAVGKSSFIMRFCEGKFLSNLSTTLGVDFKMKLIDVDGKSTAVQLWDTCGQERYRSIAKSYFRRADGVILMYDCTYERSFLNIREWISTIEESTDKKIPIILIGNKTDLRENAKKDGKKIVENEDGLRLSKEYQTQFIETSAKDGINIQESLIELTRVMRCNEDIEVKSAGITLKLEPSKKSCCWSK